MKRALPLLLLLSACPGGDTRVFSAAYTLSGHVRGARAFDDQSGGRVTCTVDVDPTDPIDPSPVFTLAAVTATDGRRQPGFYFTMRGFTGEGGYRLGTGAGDARGQMLVFDEATVTDCGRPTDASCYAAVSDCFVLLETWTLGPELSPGVATGTATGSVGCERLENPVTGETIKLLDGRFTCRASDWTAARR